MRGAADAGVLKSTCVGEADFLPGAGASRAQILTSTPEASTGLGSPARITDVVPGWSLPPSAPWCTTRKWNGAPPSLFLSSGGRLFGRRVAQDLAQHGCPTPPASFCTRLRRCVGSGIAPALARRPGAAPPRCWTTSRRAEPKSPSDWHHRLLSSIAIRPSIPSCWGSSIRWRPVAASTARCSPRRLAWMALLARHGEDRDRARAAVGRVHLGSLRRRATLARWRR